MRITRLAIFGGSLTCTLVAGCVPVVAHYLSVDAPSARHLKSTCGGAVGAPDVTYYPYHGIYISAWLPEVMLGIHVPANAEVQLETHELKVTAFTPSGTIEKTYPIALTSVRKAVGLNAPYDLRTQTDGQAYGTIVNEVMEGAVAGRGLRWCMFRAFDPKEPDLFVGLPAGASGGVFEIPAMIINGVYYPPQPLPITRKVYTEISPVNC